MLYVILQHINEDRRQIKGDDSLLVHKVIKGCRFADIAVMLYRI